MNHVQAEVVDRDLVRIREQSRRAPLVERAKPPIVIAGHDRERAAAPPKVGQGAEGLRNP